MKKLKGFMVSYRNKFRLLKERRLTDEEFVLRDYCIHAADWDESHNATFGTFDKTDKEIAEGLGCSATKICRLRNNLLAKGELTKRSDGRIEIPHFYKYLPKNAYKLTKKSANLQNQPAEMQELGAKTQDWDENIVLGSKYKTRTNTDKNESELAKMQGASFSKSDIVSYKDSFNILLSDEEDFYTFAKRAMEELKKKDPLALREQVISEEEMVAAGFDSDSLYEPCPICESGVAFSDCCGPAMYESLRGVKG